MTTYYIKVQAASRVALPKEIAAKHGIKGGDVVIVTDMPDGIRIIPAKVVPKNIKEGTVVGWTE